MLRAIAIVAFETLTLLRRDRVFIPVLVAGIGIVAFANMAALWSSTDVTKMLYDIGFFGFQLTGSLVALLWGAKSVSDSRQDGALEVQLAAPVSRTAWLLGKYLGLSACLVLVAALLGTIWQLGCLAGGFGLMRKAQLVVYAFMAFGWLVLAALALLLGTLMRFAAAFFAGLACWLAGLVSAAAALALAPETPDLVRDVVLALARFWDLQQFNLQDYALDAPFLTPRQMLYRLTYGLVLIGIMLTGGGLAGHRRDAFV